MVADTVLLAIDGSSNSENAAYWYIEHMHKPENKIILAHGMELPSMPTRETWETQSKSGSKKAKEVSDKFMEIFAKIQVTPKVMMEFEKPGEFIVSTATKEEATVIVMGTRGMGKIKRTILGSVSDFVIHNAKCPVLICRE